LPLSLIVVSNRNLAVFLFNFHDLLRLYPHQLPSPLNHTHIHHVLFYAPRPHSLSFPSLPSPSSLTPTFLFLSPSPHSRSFPHPSRGLCDDLVFCLLCVRLANVQSDHRDPPSEATLAKLRALMPMDMYGNQHTCTSVLISLDSELTRRTQLPVYIYIYIFIYNTTECVPELAPFTIIEQVLAHSPHEHTEAGPHCWC